MNANEMALRIGKQGWIFYRNMRLAVKVVDAKVAWGKVRYQVEPVAGDGLGRMDENSVQFGDQQNAWNS